MQSMNAQEFVDLLNSLSVLDASAVEILRHQTDVQNNLVSPNQLLKTLLDSGQISREQAKVVVANLQSSQSAPAGPPQEEEVIDLSQVNLTSEPESVSGEDEDIIDLSQLGQAAEAEDEEVIDLDDFGAEETTAEESAPSDMTDRRGLDEEEEANWGGLMIIGNALLFGLFCVGVVLLYVVLANNTARHQWDSALKQYTGGSYQQAKNRMEGYLEEFPSDGNANRAKIYAIMSEVHIQLVSVRKDSIERIRVALINGDTLEGFKQESENELKSLLPRLAEYYVNAARILPGMEEKKEYVALTQKTLDVIEEVRVLSDARQDNAFIARIDNIKRLIREAQGLVNRSEALETTLAQIEKYIEADSLEDAFLARNQLISTYVELQSNKALQKMVMRISEAEQSRVIRVEPTIQPNNQPIPVPPEHKVIVATRNGSNISGVQGYYVTVLAGDSVYGIELSSGSVNWRRFVGLQTNYHPIRVSDDGLSDTLLVDGARYEIVRVDSSSGEQKWRLPIGGAFTQPRMFNGMLYCNTHLKRTLRFKGGDGQVAEQEVLVGSLLTIDPETGVVQRQIQYPMGAHVEPGFDDENGIIYQVGDHSNLYAISAQTGDCVGVYYVGHEDNAIAVPAVYAVGYIILIQNGQARSTLHVLKHGENGFTRGQDSKTLENLVKMPPQVFGRRLLVSTDRGQIYVYDVDPNLLNPIGPLALMASVEGEYDDPIREFGIAKDGVLYMGGRGLVKYQVQSQLGQLKKDWAKFQTAVFVAPIQKFGNVVIYARQKQNTTRVTVSGHLVKEPDASWEVDLARTAGTAFVPNHPIQSLVSTNKPDFGLFRAAVGAEE